MRNRKERHVLSLSPPTPLFFNAFKLKLGRHLELSLGGIFQPNTSLQSMQEKGNKRHCPAVLQSAASSSGGLRTCLCCRVTPSPLPFPGGTGNSWSTRKNIPDKHPAGTNVASCVCAWTEQPSPFEESISSAHISSQSCGWAGVPGLLPVLQEHWGDTTVLKTHLKIWFSSQHCAPLLGSPWQDTCQSSKDLCSSALSPAQNPLPAPRQHHLTQWWRSWATPPVTNQKWFCREADFLFYLLNFKEKSGEKHQKILHFFQHPGLLLPRTKMRSHSKAKGW